MTSNEPHPILFTFGLHAHQPEGNFGHVFEEHLRDVYEPFLRRATEDGLLPLTMHISGPLLDWLETHGSSYLDLIGRLVDAGSLELLLAGYYEPVLPSLLREDRVEQILWMKEALQRRFGAEATGLWLTERVWEPDLPADLVDAGVEYVLVDDRHFVASGFSRESLHAPFRTEADGKSLAVFAIDERLRYLIPFQPPEETAGYLRHLRAQGRRLAVLADDIEKFGGWPGTREWVYDRGWLHRFIEVMQELANQGEVRLATFREALRTLPSEGLAYLPTASYREMEEWSLPVEASHRLSDLKHLLGEDRFSRGESPLIRGSHWKNFLVKYPEANRMHKKMIALSALCRSRGDPEAARRALGKAQCNDAYWHGVFGGLYLRHLRDTIWRNLAAAEGHLRKGESLGWEERDLDMDGQREVWIHSGKFSALVSPHRGGAVEELTLFDLGINLANTLTRRREAYHDATVNGEAENGSEEERERRGSNLPEEEEYGKDPSGSVSHTVDRAPSIHDLEGGLRFGEIPPVDPDDRALFVERVLAFDTSTEEYKTGRFEPVWSWARTEMKSIKIVGVAPPGEAGTSLDPLQESPVDEDPDHSGLVLEVLLSSEGPNHLQKLLRFRADGSVEAQFKWDPSCFPPDSVFTTELSLGGSAELVVTPDARTWRFPIETFSKSERGFDETVQGESVLIRWPISTGQSSVLIPVRRLGSE